MKYLIFSNVGIELRTSHVSGKPLVLNSNPSFCVLNFNPFDPTCLDKKFLLFVLFDVISAS